MNKKGEMMWKLVGLILGVFVVLWITSYSNRGFASTTNIISEKIDNFGDCDGDGIFNADDRCPCLSSNKYVHDELELWGCPRTIMLREDAEKDAKSCLKKCKELEDERKEAEKEEKTKVDLAIAKFVAADNFNEEKYTKDLAGDKEEIEVPLQIDIWNKGDTDFTDSFTVHVSVCKKQQTSCFPKKVIESGVERNEYVVRKDIKKGKTERIDELSIKLGKDGDYCDGSGTRDCWIEARIEFDDDSDLSNNRNGFKATLGRQNWQEEDFTIKRTIHLKAQDDEPGIRPIFQTCDGFIGMTEVGIPGRNNCNAQDSCNGKFYTSNTPAYNAEGCWVVISEEDGEGNDCGETKVKPGFVLNKLQPRYIKYDEERYNGDENPKKLLSAQFAWTPTVEGSLLCSNNAKVDFGEGFTNYLEEWLLCNDNSDGKIAKLKDDTEYVCQKGLWYRR